MLTSTTTDANGDYSFNGLRSGGNYTITPQGQTSFTPLTRSFDNLRRNEAADFFAPVKVVKDTQTPTPKSECSDSDKQRLAASLEATFGAQWRRNIERDRSRIIAATVGVETRNAVATLGPIEFQPALTTCSAALITARYAWQVKADLPQGPRIVTVPQIKRFACGKVLGAWLCN